MNLTLDDEKTTQNYIMRMIDDGEEYEPEVCGFLRNVLQPGDHFVDVGAHVGYFTIFASALVVGGKVVSFEPEDENYESLMSNIESNGYANTTAFQACVGDENKDVELFVNLDNDGGHSLFDPASHPFNTRTKKNERVKQTVPMVKLDDVIGFEPKAIKIDVEGSEFLVLKGAEDIIKRYSPVLIMEINSWALGEAGTSLKEINDYLESLGYVGYILNTGKRIDVGSIKTGCPCLFNVAYIKVYPNEKVS